LLLLANINIHLFITDLDSNVGIRREYHGTAARILQVKGSVGEISIYPQFIKKHFRFTTVPFNPLPEQK